MDNCIIRSFVCVFIVVLLSSTEAEGKKHSRKRSKKSQKKDNNYGTFMQKQQSDSFENPQDYKINCCKNGGRCIMGSFCHCPENYFGRYCEYKSENRGCGKVLHGYWFKSGCNLCRCFDGTVNCISRAYSGCDDQPKDIRDKFDPNADIYIFTTTPTVKVEFTNYKDGDNYEYYDYHDHHDHSSSNTISFKLYLLFILLVGHHM